MKKMLVVVVAALVSGCAPQQLGQWNPAAKWIELQPGIQVVASRLADRKTAYYAIELHKAGWLSWNGVIDEPLSLDDKGRPATQEVGDLLGKKTEQLFDEYGIRLIRVASLKDVPAGNVAIDIWVGVKTLPRSARDEQRGRVILGAATRWLVYYNSRKEADLYQLATQTLSAWAGKEKAPAYFAETLADILTSRLFSALAGKELSQAR